MARKLKPHLVDTIIDKNTHEKVEVFFDRNDLVFFVQVGDQKISDPTADGCKEKAKIALAQRQAFLWEKFIWIHADIVKESLWRGRNTDRKFTSLSFEFWRMEIAQRPDQSWVERPVMDEKGLRDNDDASSGHVENTIRHNRDEREKGRDISNHWPGHHTDEVRLPYNDATWAALHAVKARIEEAGKQLEEIIKSKDLEKKLLAVAKELKLLPGKAGS
jgi:hypothetical protein